MSAPCSLWQGHCHGFAIQRQDNDTCRRLLDALGQNPDVLLRAARIVKPGTRTHAGIVRIEGRDYFLKRYNDRGWWYRLRNVFLTPRALRTWRIHWEMFCRGLPVPEPYVCMVERRFGLLRRAYILMEYVAGTLPLYRAWPTLSLAQRRNVVELAGTILGRFHREGLAHRDFKWSNLIVPGGDVTKEMVVVDLDSSRFVSTKIKVGYSKDADRFLRDLPGGADTAEFRELFLSSWRKSCHGDAPLS